MSFLGDVKMYGRFALGLPRFLRNTITPEQARERIQHHLAERDQNFLRLVERGIFSYLKSPYLPLFRLAHCELGDVRNMVRDKGVEGTLLALREAGVYINFEECKGRQPIVRDGHEFPVTEHDFDNPYLKAHYYSESGGSTGVGTRVHHDLDYLAEQASHFVLLHMAHNVAEAPTAVWRGVLPDGSGINTMLRMAHYGRTPQRWFTPVAPPDPSASILRFRLATNLTVGMGRLLNVPIPWPELVRIEQAGTIAHWAADTVKNHGECVINATASRGVRVCSAALDGGLDLSGVTFVIAGEPVTPNKVRVIERSGAKHFTTYGFSEAGRIGMGCARPCSTNDLHLLTDMCAIIQYPRQVPNAAEVTVPAFNVTCLLPSSPKILLNAESDDYGVLETRSCGCLFEELGLTTHIRDIRSFCKLTGEGVTLVGSEMLHILEEVLPARFGGGPLDYQFLEEEEEDSGLTRLSLLISPRVSIPDEKTVIETVLQAIGRESTGADAARDIWSQTGTLRIKQVEPIWTGRGKLMPLHVAKRHGDTSVTPI